MVGPQRRFVKFGGGMSDAQLEWLQVRQFTKTRTTESVLHPLVPFG